MKKLVIKIAAGALLFVGLAFNFATTSNESGKAINIQLSQLQAEACCYGSAEGGSTIWTCVCGGSITCWCNGYTIPARDVW